MTTVAVSHLRLPIAAIVADDANQPRTDELDEEYIEQLAAVPELWPPIGVVQTGAGLYLLVDGFHRREAAERIGLTEIGATLLAMPPDQDLASLGFELNAKHGRPLTLIDRKREAERLLRKAPGQSDRSISQRCGIAASTVAGIRTQLERGAQIDPSAERVGLDGRTYSPPERKPGELPYKPLGQFVGDGVKALFDPKERRQMRDVARYLQRLAIALGDSRDLPGWTTAPAIASACVETLGADKAHQLACELAEYLDELIEVVDTIAPPP